jgi:hypothetical protein
LQAILGTSDEDALPLAATMSRECDILPIAESNEETARLADLIEGVAGEWSPFEEQHGFSIDGVDLTTIVLAEGWRTRLVRVQNHNTAGPTGQPEFTGWCLESQDLCAAKLCARREKDLNFVAALIDAGLVQRVVIGQRLATVKPEFLAAVQRALAWLATFDEVE